jgi:hypothetical protein
MCNCNEEEKTGTTTVMCCNICGMPDDPAWSVNQWVAVKDQLPPDETKEYEVVRNGNVEFDVWYYRDDRGYWYNYLGITHWKEKPQPPESILNNVYISEVKR